MTPEESLMRAWLAAGTPEQRRHAAALLALGFDDAPAPAPAPAAPAPAWPPCPARDDSCGCGARECRHPENGPSYGVAVPVTIGGLPEVTAYRVTADDCRRCRP